MRQIHVVILLGVWLLAASGCGAPDPLFSEPEPPRQPSPTMPPPATHTQGGIERLELTPPATVALATQVDPVKQEGVYYVAPLGDDSNSGTLAAPWRTIQKAADTLVAGEMVIIRSGVYNEIVQPRNSGTPGAEITYAASLGEVVVLDGAGLTLVDDLAGVFEINGREYIRVVGLRVINAGPYDNNAGIMVRNSSHITLQNNTTHNTQSSGIGVWDSQDIVIDGNTVELAGLSGYQECITVAITGNFEVMNNTVTGCEKEGITLKDGSHDGRVYRNRVEYPRHVGIYVDAWDKHTHDIRVFQNVVFGAQEKAGIELASEQGGLLERIRVENNLSYGNATYGIEISYCCSDQHPMNDLWIINNTVYRNGYDWRTGVETGWGGGIIADNPQAQNVVIRNNIASQNLTFQIAVAANVPQTAVTVDHNLIDGYRGYEDEVYGLFYVEGDPLFKNPAEGDFHLRGSSPAIDAGSPEGMPEGDIDGAHRPQGQGVDIGADEVL